VTESEKKMPEPLAQWFWFATITKGAALVLGVFIVYLAYTGFRRNRSRPLLFVTIGFALITGGTVAEGILYVLLGSQLLAAITAGTAITVLGFAVIIYSIYVVKD
jgi:hypothetical protein